MSQIEKLDSVAIILGFYNDKKYISAQVQSIFEQTHKNIKLFIFDDNSTFKLTKSFLKLTPENKKKLSIIRRKKNIGSAKNFLFALKEIKDDFAYYGFSDQDDIWEKDKIKISIDALNKKGNEKPILFSSRTAYFNEDCTKKIGESKVFRKKPIFANSLIQNVGGGNTMLMNKKAKKLIESSLNSDEYTHHDWFCYQLISGAGGEVIFSLEKTLKYRQHGKNLIGRNDRKGDKFRRLKKFFSGSFKNWIDINLSNIENNKSLIETKNLKILENFEKCRNSKNLFTKIIFYRKSGVFRQSSLENLIFFIGILFNKI